MEKKLEKNKLNNTENKTFLIHLEFSFSLYQLDTF